MDDFYWSQFVSRACWRVFFFNFYNYCVNFYYNIVYNVTQFSALISPWGENGNGEYIWARAWQLFLVGKIVGSAVKIATVAVASDNAIKMQLYWSIAPVLWTTGTVFCEEYFYTYIVAQTHSTTAYTGQYRASGVCVRCAVPVYLSSQNGCSQHDLEVCSWQYNCE